MLCDHAHLQDLGESYGGKDHRYDENGIGFIANEIMGCSFFDRPNIQRILFHPRVILLHEAQSTCLLKTTFHTTPLPFTPLCAKDIDCLFPFPQWDRRNCLY